MDINTIDWNEVKLTVVMPSYNRGQYIRQAIESVLMQKLGFKMLLVITDDASTDNSRKIIAEYEKQYPEKIIALYSEDNCGLLTNDLKVFVHMKSDYFCVLDPDDYWTDMHFLDKAVTFMESNPDYVIYGSNVHVMQSDLIEEKVYINTESRELDFCGIEDYLNGKAIPTNTPGTIYRNVIFKRGIPGIIKKAVGTLSEPSFRGDLDRYVMHLKYGKAKFVNELVGVYRIHKAGIWSGSSQLSRMLLSARAELDYSRFYDNLYNESFQKRAQMHFNRACVEIYRASIRNEYIYMNEYDKQNFADIMNVLSDTKEKSIESENRFDFQQEEQKVRKLLVNPEHCELIFWGTGNTAEYLLPKYYFDTLKITRFVDGDINKINTLFWNREIISPDQLKDFQNAYVVIISMYDREIISRIKEDQLCSIDRVVNLYGYDRYIRTLK